MDAVLLNSLVNSVLSTEYAFDDDIEDARPEQIHVYAYLFQVLAEGAKTPLEPEVIVLYVLILNIILILLINAVVS